MELLAIPLLFIGLFLLCLGVVALPGLLITIAKLAWESGFIFALLACFIVVGIICICSPLERRELMRILRQPRHWPWAAKRSK